ncbi:hypothetical protein INQ51_21650 [Maribellus sp. CM-23]|uniref:EamA family transporter n=1 Tax=Maribellus sp. CM-23 TaxID=2781026 RepID=UPI001F3AF24C|nr:hypothetical protein [Maribellus sp. CM-23]MCE4566942.1 hypothetical protein [Maribellus sp. CM-23]
MIYLAASILSSSMIFVVFRVAKNYQSRLAVLITINYLAATLLGIFLLVPHEPVAPERIIRWMPYAVLLGILFIVMFFFIGKSAQKAGITVTTLAAKLSLVFPVVFSLFYFNEKLSVLKILGIISAVVAVALTVYKKDLKRTNLQFVFLPLTIFVGTGLVDSLVKFVQATKIDDNEVSLYTTLVFFASFLCGICFLLVSGQFKTKHHFPTLLLGTILGMVNFGSLYFLLQALNKTGMDSSLVFALNNMLIVTLTTVFGTMIFKEQLNKINFAGILLALLSLYFLL